MDLVFLLVMILIGWGLWNWLSAIVQGEFALAVALTWLMAFGAAGWWTGGHRLVLRVPAGFLLFLGLTAVLGPLGWWSGNKILVALSAVAAALGAKYLGAWWSAKLEPKTMPGIPTPWWLDPSINLLHDVGRWVGACIVAWFALGVLPMLLVFVVPLNAVPWAAMVWSFAGLAWYFYQHRPPRGRLYRVPAGLWAFAVAAAVLALFQKQIAGPMEEGSIWLISYLAYTPAVIALFVEFVVVGTKSNKG